MLGFGGYSQTQSRSAAALGGPAAETRGRARRGLHWLGASLLSLCLASAGWAATSAPLPGSADIDDLKRTKDWILTVDDEEVSSAKIYYSVYEVAWLVQVPGLDSLLISPRGNSVQTVDAKSLGLKSANRANLKSGSTMEQVSTFEQSHGVMSFELGDRRLELRPAPPLLGRHSSGGLEQRHPEFEQKAALYSGDADAMAGLKASTRPTGNTEDLTVRVYFGSWSPICDRIVPKIIGVEKTWQNVKFEYYGLPKRITDDPEAEQVGISGVPTVLILRDGEEVDRLTGRQLDDPAPVISQAIVAR